VAVLQDNAGRALRVSSAAQVVPGVQNPPLSRIACTMFGIVDVTLLSRKEDWPWVVMMLNPVL
jgi:hypothetical protein